MPEWDFAWETVHKDESELVRRARVPGGWLVSHLLRTDPPVPSALTFVPDGGHTWATGTSALGTSEGTRANAPAADAAPDADLAKRASAVVARGGAGILTTEAELDCFEELRKIARTREPEIEIGFLDTPTYFGVHIGGPSRWFARLCITPRTSWIALNLSADARIATPAGSVPLEANWAGPVRFALTRPSDIAALAPLVLAAIDNVR